MFGHTDPASYTDYRVYMAGVLVPLLLLVSIRNLKYLSPVSMLANLLQFTGLGITFYFLLQADMQAMFDDVVLSYNMICRECSTSCSLNTKNPHF